MGVATLLAGVTAIGVGVALGPFGTAPRTYQASETGTGAVSSTVVVEVSNDNVNFLPLGTITLAGASGVASDGFASQAQWQYVRGNVTAVSGVGAAVTLQAGVQQ